MIKILIVDDNHLFRERLKTFLASYSEVEVFSEAKDGLSAFHKIRELEPNIVLMDVSMDGMNGLEATERLKKEWPEVVVIILSKYDLGAYRDAAKIRGASAYVVKKDLVDDLVPAIYRVMRSNQST